MIFEHLTIAGVAFMEEALTFVALVDWLFSDGFVDEIPWLLDWPSVLCVSCACCCNNYSTKKDLNNTFT